MRLFLVAAVFCLTLVCSTAQAQTSAGNASGPLADGRTRFAVSDIDEAMVREFNGAWRQCVLGTKATEAVVLVLRGADGSPKAVSAGRSNQFYKFTFNWNPAIIAIFHTHPNNRDPKPVEEDIAIARRFDVPIFTLSRKGMFMYSPAADRTIKIKGGLDWLDYSRWRQEADLAITKRSQREH